MTDQAVVESSSQEKAAPPPPSPTYDHMFGNQFRWAKQVVRYALQKRKNAKAEREDRPVAL